LIDAAAGAVLDRRGVVVTEYEPGASPSPLAGNVVAETDAEAEEPKDSNGPFALPLMVALALVAVPGLGTGSACASPVTILKSGAVGAEAPSPEAEAEVVVAADEDEDEAALLLAESVPTAAPTRAEPADTADAAPTPNAFIPVASLSCN